MEEIRLMKGNEAIAEAAIRYGCDGYFGYPITPQSEIMETLMELQPWKTTGMVVLQAESEVSAINMVYGGAGCGKSVMTSSSSPGVSLKQEGISYIACAELPCLIVNVMRGGPGLGTIQPSQADYFQAVKGGGHGDYRLIVLAPSSVQEMADFVALGFDLAFKYRTPSMIIADGIIGQMMEKVILPPYRPRRTNDEIRQQCPWATLGKPDNRERNVTTSLALEAEEMERRNLRLQAKYKEIYENEVNKLEETEKYEKSQLPESGYMTKEEYDDFIISNQIPTREGYTFVYQYERNYDEESSEFTETVTLSSTEIIYLTAYNSTDEGGLAHDLKHIWVEEEDSFVINVTAIWTANTYTVEYNANLPREENGYVVDASGVVTGSISSQSFTYDVPANLPAVNTYKLVGWTQVGWNTAEDGTGVDYLYANDGCVGVRNITSVNGAVVTLFAKWEQNRYTLHFEDLSGENTGAYEIEDRTIVYDTRLTLNDLIFNDKPLIELTFNTTEGYWEEFVGWKYVYDGNVSERTYTNDQEILFALAAFFAVDLKVINLTETEAIVLSNQPINVDFNEEAEVLKQGMRYHNIPSVTKSPTKENVNKFLNLIKDIENRSGKAHIHCKAGADRTGMYAFIYKMLKGIGTLAGNEREWLEHGHNTKLYPDLRNWAKNFVKTF